MDAVTVQIFSVDNLKTEPLMVSVMKNTSSDVMKNTSSDPRWWPKIKYFLFLKVPN